ncbi:hypothetical protein KBW71_00410 [Hydrogenophaga aromaticivorans]|uniref:DotH/IcmK family type IV secretion protein n=1 Tax=Hydrogenophaga aromaticivorans TaxID=2610898 RepID=UPI001B36E04D|nr:DotH/IcmK family type IV secretion protein [Hydrogenophaga aromaticivorans]MBQ0916912.1 hypothetical protein [Hydrogenophaga aromaticivorans]
MKKLACFAAIMTMSAPSWSQYVPPQTSSPVAQERQTGYTTRVTVPQPAPMPSPLPSGGGPDVNLVQEALDQAAPLTAQEIREFMQEFGSRTRAAAENHTGRPPARPVTSVEQLDLSPGATPPVVRVALGQGAVLSFQDAAGRPWPIVDNLNFNATAFTTKLIAEHLYSVAFKRNAPANLTVVLKGLARPIVITALPATEEADYLKEFTVPRFLDGAPPAAVSASASEGAITLNATELLNYLYRTPPATARELDVKGVPGVLAWQTGDSTMVIRTDGLVVLPAWVRRHVASDGMGVYEMPISPVVSISKNGSVQQLLLSGYNIPSIAASGQ